MSERLVSYLAVLGLTGQPVAARLASGQFHDVVLAGEVAYRFPRDEESRRRLPAAVALLAALSEAGLPAAVPRPLGVGLPTGPLGACHVPLSRLSGHPFDQLADPGGSSGPGGGGPDDSGPDDSGPGDGGPDTDDGLGAEEAVIADLTALLDRLADLGTDPGIADLVPRADPGFWFGFAAQVRDVLYPLMSAVGRRRAHAELAAVTTIPAAGDALVHTDLGGANLLWTATNGVPRLTGVLDWDQAWIGDQASDLASIAVTVGWPLARRIDARRQHAGARPMLADATAIAATFALQQALPAALTGDQPNLDDGLRPYR